MNAQATAIYLMIPRWDPNAVGKDQGIGAVEQRYISPSHNDPSLLAKKEGVETEVVHAQVQPALSG